MPEPFFGPRGGDRRRDAARTLQKLRRRRKMAMAKFNELDRLTVTPFGKAFTESERGRVAILIVEADRYIRQLRKMARPDY